MGILSTFNNIMPLPTLGATPPTLANAMDLTDRYRLAELMRMRAFDTENNVAMIDDGHVLSAGIGFRFVPLLVAGVDTERQVENLCKELPIGSVLQFLMVSWPDTYRQLDAWERARRSKSPKQIYKDMARARVVHFERANQGMSLTVDTRMFPRDYSAWLFVVLPGIKSSANEREVGEWLKDVRRRQESIVGRLSATGMYAQVAEEPDILRLVRMLNNPNLGAKALDDEILGRPRKDGTRPCTGRMPNDVLSKGTRMQVMNTGDIAFTGGTEVHMRAITVDMYPEQHYLYSQRKLIGDLLDANSRIAVPFCAYTNIHILDPQSARDRLMTSMGIINKQTLSDSAWFRSMMGHLFTRRDETQAVLDATTGAHVLVRAYSGLNIYAEPREMENASDAARSLWNKAGFQCSPERYLSLPVYLASQPFGYGPKMDPPNRGLQRAELMTSLNAATLAFVASDWAGSGMGRGGPLLITRRGQVASIDLFKSDTNYNFAVVASSGSGKSFFANELVVDFLSRGGLARIVDVGRSYEKLATLLGGQVIEYDLANPRSINPLWGITDKKEMDEMLPMFKAMVTMMAYPRHEPPAWEYQSLEHIILEAWNKSGEKLGMKDIYESLNAHGDKRATDMADQVRTYAVGRLADWFNGEPKVTFRGDFSILELDGLNADKELRNVVLAQAIHSITRDMYRSSQQDKERPKLVLIDEAWDLLGDSADSKASAEFIETIARRVRKYHGALGTVTQGYNDYYQSRAAQAALENSAWRITLRQKPDSLRVAKQNEIFPASDELLWKMLATVNPGSGYSEIHIANDVNGEVFRFVVDPLSYWVYTTNPMDKAKIAANAAQHKDTEIDAVYRLAQEKIEALNLEYGPHEGAKSEAA